ncbi:MAG: sugar transferase [Acidimicrobiales bacterium]|nr:sugar transferase [Acidimicrobiales bacterium]
MHAAERIGAIPVRPPPVSSSASSTKWVVVGVDMVMAASGIVISHGLADAGPHGVVASAVLLVSWALWLTRARLYSIRFITRRSEEIRRVIDAGIRAVGTMALVGFLFRWDVSRIWVLLAITASTAALLLERELLRRVFNGRRRNGSMRRPILIIGDNDEGSDLALMFATDPNLGYQVCGMIATTNQPDRTELVTDVFTTLEQTGATGAVIAATALPSDHMNRLVRDLLDAGIHVELSSSLADIEPHRLTVRPLGRYPVVYVEAITRRGWRAGAKRGFDIAVALIGLVLASPMLVLIALAIRLDSPGRVLFAQERVGRNGVLFKVLKFRTMVADAEQQKVTLLDANEGAGPLFKLKHDPRVTRVGHTLRTLSLDEIPQLWNVVRGEMSLVGPRPALPSETKAWDDDLFGRLRVRPGITGMWQVSGRSGTTFEEYTRLDLFYVDNWSLVVDLSILVRTIPAVLKSDGAY